MPYDSTSLPVQGPSAFVGQPPNTLHDYRIIRGLFRMIGMAAADPVIGYPFAPKPPPGYTHESRFEGVLAGMIVVIVLMLVPTGARLILRARMNQMQFGSDDWVILIATILSLAYPIAQICGLYVGGGSIHLWEVTYAEYDIGMFIGTLSKILFYEAVGLIKISIALFIRRLADHTHTSRKWRWFCDIFIATVVAYVLFALFWLVFTCDPPNTQWSLYNRGSHVTTPQCADAILQARVLSGIHVAQGFVLLSSPIIILWTVQMDRSKKIRLFIYWIIGGICILGGLLRQVRTKVHADMTWEYVEYLGTTCVDLVLGLLTASLPVIDGIFPAIWHKTIMVVGRMRGLTRRENQKRLSRSRLPVATHEPSESSEDIVGKIVSYELSPVPARSLDVRKSSVSSFAGSDLATHEVRKYIH